LLFSVFAALELKTNKITAHAAFELPPQLIRAKTATTVSGTSKVSRLFGEQVIISRESNPAARFCAAKVRSIGYMTYKLSVRQSGSSGIVGQGHQPTLQIGA